MNSDDRIAREIVRQSRSKAMGNRLMAGSAGNLSMPLTTTTTRVDGTGKVRRLFIPDTDALDDGGFYLGSSPIEVL